MKLEKHIIDTIKEWHLKIGYQKENIRLYFPLESVKSFLNIDAEEKSSAESLCDIVQSYLLEKMSMMGSVKVSQQENRFCIEISKELNEYIAKHIEPSEFLQKFLKVLSSGHIEEVRKLFQDYAEQKQGHYVEEPHEGEGGIAFSFQEERIDPYVYCVEQDDFGLTYHRFVKKEYEKLFS